MTIDYRPGSWSYHHIADQDADGVFLYITALTSGGNPVVLMMPATLDSDAFVSLNASGDQAMVRCGDLSSYWTWIAGDFGSNIKVMYSNDAGSYWYTALDDAAYWYSDCEAMMIGPGNDERVTVSNQYLIHVSNFLGDGTLYWLDRNIVSGYFVTALDRIDVNPDVGFQGFYSGSDVVDASENDYRQQIDISDSLPSVRVNCLVAL